MKTYLEVLLNDAGVVEVRHLPAGESGTFDNVDDLIAALAGKTGNLYTSLNRPQDQTALNAFGASAFRDDDIARIIRLPFDFDPVKPTGQAATDYQIEDAKQRCEGFLRDRHAEDWPIPLVGFSGNGYHLQYRMAAQANDETKEMLKLIYKGLKPSCSNDVVDFDITVRNPSRIFRLYGTRNRKGGRNTSCRVPSNWRQVRLQQIEKLAERFIRQPVPKVQKLSVPVVGRGNFATLDVVRWFQAHGLYEHPIESNKHAVICPWEHEHSESSPNDTLIFEADHSWPGFFCHHAHCEGRTIRDVIGLFGDADAFCREAWRSAS